MFKIHIITIFPEVYPGLLNISLLKKALKNEIWTLSITDLKKFSKNGKRIDDSPFGGGPGMIIRPDVLQAAYENILEKNSEISSESFAKVIFTPRGKRLEQSTIKNWSALDGMVLVCGRYEGFDERFIEKNNFNQTSLGDFVLMGGEIASMATVESVVRLLPGVLGNKRSLEDESFNNETLEYPQYTRPRIWEGKNVPQTLLSGNHKEIEKWKKKNTSLNIKKNNS